MLRNIQPKNNDAFYRYKMPVLEIKKNCKNTILLNLSEISKSLNCPIIIIPKYLSITLGTIVKHNKKDNTTIIKGIFNTDSLNSALDTFIELFILCKKCKYPELFYEKNNARCQSCGEYFKLPSHKITKLFETKSLINNKPKEEFTVLPENIDEEEVVWYSDTSKKAMIERRNEFLK